MNNKDNKITTFRLWEVIIITLISSLVMSLSTGYVVFRGNKLNNNPNNSKELNEIIASYNNIVNNYYNDIDETALVDAALNGMLKYLEDPYTTYLNETNTSILTNSLKGTYEGIGIAVNSNENNEIVIREVFEDTPASEAGLKVNDIITKINNTDLTDGTATDAVNIIKESTTNEIKIEIKRDNEIKNIIIEKKSLIYPSVYKDIFNHNNQKIGYLSFTTFSDTIYEQFNKALKSLEESNINSLIIDLRGNSGGYLVQATKIAEIFLNKGKVIYSLESKNDLEVVKDTTDENCDYKVFILINKGSASAAEVLASALKYSYNATLIGTKSYGKGKVQKTSKLTDGTMYKYTAAKWLTPNGNCIDEVGLTPDIEVELNENYTDNPTFENDNQLQKAIEEISK